MSPWEAIGKILIGLGVVFVVVGVLLLVGRHVPFLGHLPGDFSIERRGLHVFVPLATCLLVSVILTLVLNLLIRK